MPTLEELSFHSAASPWPAVLLVLLLGPSRGYTREPLLPCSVRAKQTPHNRREFPLPVMWIAKDMAVFCPIGLGVFVYL